jgi:hypothetical protein
MTASFIVAARKTIDKASSMSAHHSPKLFWNVLCTCVENNWHFSWAHGSNLVLFHKAVRVWSWPLTYSYLQGKEWVELYVCFTYRLGGVHRDNFTFILHFWTLTTERKATVAVELVFTWLLVHMILLVVFLYSYSLTQGLTPFFSFT